VLSPQKRKVRSIILVRRAGLELAEIRTIAADTSSRASLAYLQIMTGWWSETPVRFVPHAPHLDEMLKAADAAMLIGDPALFALEDRVAREKRTGEKLVYLDLAEEWTAAFRGTRVVSSISAGSYATQSRQPRQVRKEATVTG